MDNEPVDRHDDQYDGRDIDIASDDNTSEADIYRVETEFDAAPAEVWRMLTEPESMRRWLGSPIEVTLEPAADGTLGDDGDGDGDDHGDGDGATVLVVEEVDVQRRLVFRWASAREAPTVVEFDLYPTGRGTRLTIVERRQRGHGAGTAARACSLALAA